MQVLLLLLVLNLSGADGRPTPVSTRVLQAGSVHVLDVPPFSFFEAAQSDNAGDLFFHVDAGSYRRVVVLKLEHSSSDPTLYALPDEEQRVTSFLDFSVTPSGRVYILYRTSDMKSVVARFSSKGEAAEKIKLDISEHAKVKSFLVFDTGTMLVSGYYGPNAPEKLRGKALAALFDESGKVVKDLGGEFADVDTAKAAKSIREGACAVGPDGNLYLLQGSEILAISEAGAIVRRIKFDKPRDFVATKIVASRSLVAIWLDKQDAKNTVTSSFLVLNLLSGDPLALYVPSEELGETAVSFSNEEGFTFFVIDQGRVRLVSAPLK